MVEQFILVAKKIMQMFCFQAADTTKIDIVQSDNQLLIAHLEEMDLNIKKRQANHQMILHCIITMHYTNNTHRNHKRNKISLNQRF
jgi:folate-binding Fe-S cluster repair protein YgfZ